MQQNDVQFGLIGQLPNGTIQNKITQTLFALCALITLFTFSGLAYSNSQSDNSQPTPKHNNIEQTVVERWAAIKQQVFADRPIAENGQIISIDAAARAFDSARVPVTLRALLDQNKEHYIQKLYLIVDKNPVPIAGTFTFEPNDGWQTIDTELRINEYTDMRVVAEMNNGDLHMDSRFIKAVGGCSAPPSSYDRSDQSQFGVFEASITNLLDPKVPALARIRIVHPNASGMQFDQFSRTYIPAHYIHTMSAEFNGNPLFHLETNFSLSQDPVLGFNFEPKENGELKLSAIDSKQQTFEKTWRINAASQ